MKTLLGFFAMLSCTVFGQTMQRIPLKVSDAYQTNHVTQDVTYLIDDNPNTRFHPTFPGYNTIIHPHNVVFDLSDFAPCIIQKLVMHDGSGSGCDVRFIFVRASDGHEDTVYTFTGDNYQTDITVNIPAQYQYIASKLILRTPSGGDCYPDDIQVWGTYTPHADPVWTRPKHPLKDLMQVVVHPWDIDSIRYPAKYQALLDLGVSGVRVYSDVYADKDSQGRYMLNPELRGFQTEQAFAALKRHDSTFVTQLAFLGQSPQISQTWQGTGHSTWHDRPYGLSTYDPVTYSEISKDMFVLATRGGQNANLPNYAVHPQDHFYDVPNEVIKGGKFYSVIEGGNEWDGWYSGNPSDTYLGGKELAVAWSAMYDGHKGLIANGGIKAADPNVLFTNGGIAWDFPDLFREAVDYWKVIRGYKDGQVDIPVDWWSFHSYSSAGGQHSGSEGGVPPEQGMLPQIRKMIYFSNKYGGGKPMVIGEWGWDVNPASPLNAPAYGRYSAEQTRANWAIRGILSFSEAGLEYAQWFRGYQDYYPGDARGGNYSSDHNAGQFATMALLRQENDEVTVITRTRAGDYYKQLSEFGNYFYDNTLRNDSVHVIRFKKDTSYMYAIWAEESTVVPQNSRPIFTERTGIYNLTVPLNAILKIRNLKDDGSGVMDSKLDVATGNSYQVNYSAKPQFIQVLGQAYVLPVQSLSFTAVRLGKNVQLSWSVQNENLSSYVVERSADGTNFLPIAVVNATKEKMYRAVDDSPFVGNNYYRLKMIDANGAFKYSEIRLVVMKKEKIKYIAYNFLGQQLSEGDDFLQVNFQAKAMLKHRQAYIIKGTDGSVLKLINNTPQ